MLELREWQIESFEVKRFREAKQIYIGKFPGDLR